MSTVYPLDSPPSPVCPLYAVCIRSLAEASHLSSESSFHYTSPFLCRYFKLIQPAERSLVPSYYASTPQILNSTKMHPGVLHRRFLNDLSTSLFSFVLPLLPPSEELSVKEE